MEDSEPASKALISQNRRHYYQGTNQRSKNRLHSIARFQVVRPVSLPLTGDGLRVVRSMVPPPPTPTLPATPPPATPPTPAIRWWWAAAASNWLIIDGGMRP